MLASIAGLLGGIAAVITSVTGLVGMFVVARRTSPRERDEAARTAAEQALNPPSQLDRDSAALELVPQRKRRRRRGR